MYDYEIYKGVQSLLDNYEDRIFEGIISISFNFPKNDAGSIHLINFFEVSNFLRKIDEMAKFAENTMYSISEIKKSEKTYFKDVVHYSNDIMKLYFDEYQLFDDNTISFTKSSIDVEISNEHGSSAYEPW